MKEPAETYLGRKVNDAVVAVPAYSVTPSVRPPRKRNHCRAQHDAFTNELTAVATTYGLETRAVRSAMFWSKDMGGGTCDGLC